MRVLNPLVRMGVAAKTMMLHASQQNGGGGGSGIAPPTTPNILDQLPPLAPDSRRVILIPHGQTDWNSRGMMQGGDQDVELNWTGKLEAGMVRDALRGLPVGVIASSHLSRSSDTADIIAAGLTDRPIRIVNHRLGEMRLGEFEGMALTGPESTTDARNKFDTLNAIMRENKEVPWPGGGESIADVQARAVSGVNQVLRGFPDCDHICIVGHGRWNKVLLMQLLADDHDLKDIHSFEQGDACINVLDVDAKGVWKLKMMNHVKHLESAFA